MKKYLFIFGLLLTTDLLAQTITGKVTDVNNEPLAGASIYWLDTAIGTTAGINGQFQISADNVSDKRLIASYVGYIPDTIQVNSQTFVEFRLQQDRSLDEVVINVQRPGVVISDLKAIKTEHITQVELTKAACCDLAGCFETQATVQPQTSNVITNSKELRILGLSGVYNQILIDGLPMIRGLSYTYGISSFPGTLVDNIYVSKGANSVLQGFSSISGQINVETKEPDKTDHLFLNAYINNFMEKQFNANYAFKHGKWSNLTALHTTQPANRTDRNGDNFLDLPLLTRYMIFNKWKYGNEKDWGWSSSVSLRYLNEQRVGGQRSFNSERDKGSTSVYGQLVNISQPEAWTKTSYRINSKHNIVLFASAFYQDQNSYFGTVIYNAQHANAYGNLQYEFNYGKHDLKAGISYRYMDLNEDVSFTDTSIHRTYSGHYNRLEHITGIFAENTSVFFNDKLTWIAGFRLDHHNQFGAMYTPRTLVKFNIKPRTIIRANAGTGWRTANPFSENINLLVSSRDVIFTEELQPERALNFGLNLTQNYNSKSNMLTGYLSIDFYQTNFQNQIFPDYYTDATRAIIQNFKGKSVSNSFQAEFYMKIWKRFEFKTGYNYLEVFHEIGENQQLLPFNPKHRILVSYSYRPLSDKFHFDLNTHWFGRKRLPNTASNPVEYQRPDFSKAYILVNAQITYSFKKFELYAGCENIFNFIQNVPIISWQDPFGPYFDTSSVWGPTRGREIYAGVRFRMNKS